MANTVNKIPSINLPLTNEQGIIHPIWYEFLRSFISSVGDTGGGSGSDNTVIAGAGISGTGAVSTVNVGAGEGIIVGSDSVGIDIIHQNNAQAALEDEILIADASDLSRIRKTSLRDVAALSVANPGGLNTYVQYNSNGTFEGHSGLTYNGAGSLGINGTLTINGTTFTSATSSNKFIFNVPAGTATDHYTFRQLTGTGSSSMQARFGSALSSTMLYIDNSIDSASTTALSSLVYSRAGTEKWAIGLTGSVSGSNLVCATSSNLNTGIIWSIDGTTNNMSMSQSLFRNITAGITASTTQTQGQRPLTTDINEVATVANANDTVTLPAALAGRRCAVINNGANTLKIFPASGDNLGAGLNTSTTLASGSNVIFESYDSTNWETTAGSSLYTDEMAQDAVGAMVDASLNYVDGTPLLQRAALTGDVTASEGSNATTVVLPASATVATDDKVYIFDTSDSNAKKYVTTQSIRDLAPGSGTITSAQLRAALTDESGTGAALFAGGDLGACTATSINFGQDALNYYDQGTFTPTFTSSSPGDLSTTYAAQEGAYTRIGNIVYVNVNITFTPTFTTAIGGIRLGGLPFTVAGNNSVLGITVISNDWTWQAGKTMIAVNANSGTTYCTVITLSSATNASSLEIESALVSGVEASIAFTGVYSV